MKNIKKLVAVILCLTLLGSLAACGGNSGTKSTTAATQAATEAAQKTEAPAAAEGHKIAICVNSFETVFYRDICDYIESVMGENDTLARFDPGEDSAKQITILEDCIVKGYDLIFTTCMDPVGMKTIFESAQSAGIPVIVYDFASEDPDLVETTVVFDDYQLGELQARGILEAMGGKGKLIKYFDTSMSGPAKRNQALEDVLKEYPDVELVAGVEGPPMSEYSYPGIESMLTSNPDADGLWTMAGAAGCAGCAVKIANNNDKLIVGTCGIDQEVSGYIRDGLMYGCVGQFAEDIGEIMWMAAEKVFAGESDSLEEIYYVDAVWVTAENIDQYWPAE